MNRDEFFDRLLNAFKDSDIDCQELLADDGEGGIYVRFNGVEEDADA